MEQVSSTRELKHLRSEVSQLQELQQSKEELANRVQALRKDLKERQIAFSDQLANCNTELNDLRKQLVLEFQLLQAEFTEMRASLQQQIDGTAKAVLAARDAAN